MAEDPTQLDNALRRGKDARARFDAGKYISEQDADRMALADEIERLRTALHRIIEADPYCPEDPEPDCKHANHMAQIARVALAADKTSMSKPPPLPPPPDSGGLTKKGI